MKKSFFILAAVVFALVGCQSKEDKANKLIKDYMFKHLHDFKSYEVVETKLDTLYNKPITDLECINLAKEANEHAQKSVEYGEIAEQYSRTMEIWSGLRSISAGKEFLKACESWCENKKNETFETIAAIQAGKKILERAKTLNGHEQIGWIAYHTFRSNTLGGNMSLRTYQFFVDKDFKNIIATFDDDEEQGFAEAVGSIEKVITDFETPERMDTLAMQWQSMIEKYDETLERLKK